MDQENNRLTWGGLFRILGRRRDLNFEKTQIKAFVGGEKIYLNLFFDKTGMPCFKEAKKRRENSDKERKERYENHRNNSHKKSVLHKRPDYRG